MSARKAESETAAAAPANKTKNAPSPSRGKRWLAVIVLTPLFLMGVGVLAWKRVGPHVTTSAEYQVGPDSIDLQPRAPRWIHSDITAEVMRDASLDGPLSVLETDLTLRVAQAYAAHPWIAKVHRVSKHRPAKVEVEVSYRQPVAMVRSGKETYPVDADGVVLPSSDFSVADIDRYPQIVDIASQPQGPVGTRWQDARVQGGAAIAGGIFKDWHSLRLARIMAVGQPTVEGDRETWSYELFTPSGTRILWGRPPGREMNGELPAAQKLARLVGQAAGGSLEGAPERIIDIRTSVTPLPERPAHRPQPSVGR